MQVNEDNRDFDTTWRCAIYIPELIFVLIFFDDEKEVNKFGWDTISIFFQIKLEETYVCTSHSSRDYLAILWIVTLVSFILQGVIKLNFQWQKIVHVKTVWKQLIVIFIIRNW